MDLNGMPNKYIYICMIYKYFKWPILHGLTMKRITNE